MSKVILKPNNANVPKTHVTTIPMIINGTNTVSIDLKKINKIIPNTTTETISNIVSSFFTLSARMYLE